MFNKRTFRGLGLSLMTVLPFGRGCSGRFCDIYPCDTCSSMTLVLQGHYYFDDTVPSDTCPSDGVLSRFRPGSQNQQNRH